jgi:hypothetical protein
MLATMLTRHAAARMQQRGIGAREVADLLAFGRDVHDRHGGIVVLLDRHARRQARRAGVTGARLDRLAGVYLVEVGGGAIATVGHRHRRRRR